MATMRARAAATCVVLAATAAFATSVPPTMQAVKATGPCARPNFTNCIAAVSVPTPKPVLGSALIRVNSSSVNPSDVDAAVSFGKAFGIYGVDMAGEVVAVGPGCPRLAVGDRVWGCTKGAYAEYAIGFCAITGKAPTNLPLDVAGTVPEVGMTGLEALTKCGAPFDPAKNITVVITSGSGGTGTIGIQLAKALGAARVVTAASGAANIALVKSLGADEVIDYKVENIFDALQNNSVDVVYDNYGAKGSADRAMPKIRPGGVYLLLPGGEKGSLSKHPRPGVRQIDFGEMIPSLSALDKLRDLFEAGKLKTHVQETFPLFRVADAFGVSNSGTVVGKLAIRP